MEHRHSRITEVMYANCLSQCLAHNNHLINDSYHFNSLRHKDMMVKNPGSGVRPGL